MELFWRLYLAHLLADFPFQTNRIFAWKTRSFAGVLVHAVVVVLTSTVMLWPALVSPDRWVILTFLGLTHAIQDHLKVVYSRHSGRDGLTPYLLDQLGHLTMTALAILAFRPWTLESVSWPEGWGLWATVYNSDWVVMISCAVIVVTYGMDIARHLRHGDKGPLVREWYGMVERAGLVLAGAFTLWSPWAWLLVGFWAVLRLGNWSRRQSRGIPSAVVSLVLGLFLIRWAAPTTRVAAAWFGAE
ncbi:MAG: DUF3307 domain-containing protein [Candidatus Sericytochromatia bacterium]|nr:DUF3307 domain-containing protein [Candidatus Sericytochromatia bacterium]